MKKLLLLLFLGFTLVGFSQTTLNVIENPTVYAGPNQAICEDEIVNPMAATASNYNSLYWTSSGDGLFTDVQALFPIYVPGPYDITSGIFVLTLTAIGTNNQAVSDAIVITIELCNTDILLNGIVSAENHQIKNVADPTEAQDAVTKSYADALSNTQGLMNFNDWDNYQVLQDNTTITLTPNSFLFLDANNTTLIFPDGSENGFGDVIYIYVVQDNSVGVDITLQPSGFPIRIPAYDQPSYDNYFGILGSGLNTIINVGGYWMVANFIGDGNPTTGSITDQDGNTYNYLTYGNQVWTVDNAAMETYRDGTPIPQQSFDTDWSNLTTGAWCYYDNDSTKGKLYNWYAVMGIHDTDDSTPNKEFAPEGWHVSRYAEWTNLENHLISNGYNYDGATSLNKIAKSIASTTGWLEAWQIGSPGNNQSLNNDSGFNAFPEGGRGTNGSFYGEGYDAIFWTSTTSSSTGAGTLGAWRRKISAGSLETSDYYDNSTSGLSVRFVRD